MRVIFCGTPQVAVASLDALYASSHEVCAVLTRPDATAGRGRRVLPSPVKVRATELGLPVLTPTSLRDEEIARQLRELDLDIAAVVAYGALIPPELLDVPRHGWVNLHFSILPAWRGAAPVQHAILHGDDLTGATTFQIEEGLDTGPTFGVVTERIDSTDTAGALLERLSTSGAGLLTATLDAIGNGTAAPQPQPLDGVSLAPKITADDAHIRWNEPALALSRRIRACTPAPGAWTELIDNGDTQRMKIAPVTLEPQAPELTPGQILIEKSRVLVGTGSHPVALGDVSPAGRSWMSASAWARGARLGPNPTFDHE